jgi:hypothetical protein
MVQRKKKIRLIHISRKDAATIRPLIDSHIRKGATIHHDNNTTYGDLKAANYNPKLVGNKSGKEFKRGVHNNNIETNWSAVKARIFGSHIWVSGKHLQTYLDEYCYYYDTNKSKKDLLSIIQQLMTA